MSDAWVRVDDRLIHGQILYGWAPHLSPRRILLASDMVSADPGLAAMYRALGEGEYAIDVLDVAAAALQLREPRTRQRTLLVLGSIRDARRMLELGARLERVNLGGLHGSSGRRRLSGSVFLSEPDAQDLRRLLERGVRLEAQDVPGSAVLVIDFDTLAAIWP